MTFGYTETELKKYGAVLTAKEIAQQPDMWLKTLDIVENQKEGLSRFIENVTSKKTFNVLMVGAGSSNYVGEIAGEALNVKLPYRISCCGSTDLIVEPEKYIQEDVETLLVSFARSGGSPESIAAVEISTQLCRKISHIFITCNSEGELAKYAKTQKNCFLLELPPETDDRGFAMTSSFSSMYIAALAVFQLDRLAEFRASLKTLSRLAERFIENGWRVLKELVDSFDFDRAVYLGTGILRGISREAALKMLELTGGRVAALYETPLGFRHGPKSIIDDKTLTVLSVSGKSYVKQYEMDIASELSRQRKKNKLMIISAADDEKVRETSDFNCLFPEAAVLEEEFASILNIIPMQLLALLKSMKKGIQPDNPCPNGEVNRVVKGVTIYAYPKRSLK